LAAIVYFPVVCAIPCARPFNSTVNDINFYAMYPHANQPTAWKIGISKKLTDTITEDWRVLMLRRPQPG